MESKDQTSFVIPSLIPPLPSSTAGKENERDASKNRLLSSTEITKQSPSIATKAKRKPFGLRTPQTSDISKLGRPYSANEGSRRLSPSPGPITSSTKKRTVLRYGETTESFFCLINESSEEHRQLCRGIVEGTLSDDSSAWRRVLELATKLKTSGSDLIRLHRRATLRFSVDMLQGRNSADVLAMWLSFAQLHATLGSVDEARRTFRHVENQKIPLGASFYLTVAKFEREHDSSRVEGTLLRGIDEKAKPVQKLEEALKKLNKDKKQSSSAGVPSMIPSLSSRPEGGSRSPRKRVDDPETSPKRLKTENGYIERKSDLDIGKSKPDESGQDRRESKSRIESASEIKATESHKSSLLLSRASIKLGSPSLIKCNKLKPASVAMTSKDSISGKESGATGQNRLSSRLSRKGLSGKAKRVDPEVSMFNESESEQDTECSSETAELTDTMAANSTRDVSESTVSRYKKVDLSYMWEWDPNAREKTQDIKQCTPAMEKIDEGSTSGQSTNASQGTTRGSDGTANSSLAETSRQKVLSNQTRKEPEKAGKVLSSKTVSCPAPNDKERSISRKEALVDKANLEFLPLVHENNILRVNRIAYAKLGVIGKGGSCKVYRALSKKCSVVAIKKVKLAGMDKKAIAGYANEISLLKRLKGNPAIIQMYDSEVDLERKSIFVVMEVGEVDLNHVLQQRALSGTCRSLNMNFIRLTWQQMLSAVHCIHEERIIHSDLKPANFLFVRGALKLIDFGIAKAIQSDDTTNIYRESHIGTLNYMSPEAILDTGSGQNGPRMKIGRVRMNNTFLLRLTLFFSKLCLLCRLPMFGLLVVFSMKWCMGSLRLQTLTLFQSFKQL
jgi:serine/threonine-protein kinase TTK/MPS1